MGRRLAGYAARLDRLEDALGTHQMAFRTATGRRFTLDVTDVLCVALDCMTWMYDESTDQPRGRIVEQLAGAELEDGQGLIGHTAILAARQVLEGTRR